MKKIARNKMFGKKSISKILLRGAPKTKQKPNPGSISMSFTNCMSAISGRHTQLIEVGICA